MSEYTHTERGLALYLGVECQYIYKPNGRKIPGPLYLDDVSSVSAGVCEEFTLYLRPASKATEDEKAEIIALLIELGERHEGMEEGEYRQLVMDFLNDHYRKIGLDRGGWCMKDGQEIWVESFLAVGLAKEVQS